MQWDPAVDLDAPVTADMVVNAVPLQVTVTFQVGDDVVALLTQTIDYGGTIDVKLLEGYVFPSGYDAWDADLTMPVYADTVIKAKEIVVEQEPGFFDSPVNVLIVILAVLVVIAVVGFVLYLRAEDRLPKALVFLARKSKDGEQ